MKMKRSQADAHRAIKTGSYALGKEVDLFQSINFIDGSEQKAHADSIPPHSPRLFIGVWIALEDMGGQGLYSSTPAAIGDYVLTEEIDAGDNYFCRKECLFEIRNCN